MATKKASGGKSAAKRENSSGFVVPNSEGTQVPPRSEKTGAFAKVEVSTKESATHRKPLAFTQVSGGPHVPPTEEHHAGSQPFIVDVMVRLQAIAVPEEGGGYSVVVPALPGCVTEADTVEEIRANVREAAEGWLEVAHDRHKVERLRGVRG